MSHSFHIPVLGLGFTIDTPLKVARYGISSVVSIVDDLLIERMRKFHCEQNEEPYIPIGDYDDDSRAERIRSYLNLLNKLVNRQFELLKEQALGEGTDLDRYFELLPESSPLRIRYDEMLLTDDVILKAKLKYWLVNAISKGAIDVNIMSKLDKVNYMLNGESRGEEYTDALAALRGFAMSDLDSSIILSAGMNPRLYSYLENFPDFFPDASAQLKKKLILKVSDFRSAFIQAKFVAKKGLWVSEFRIESGLNCGGHAFATEGYLIGPILEEFRSKRSEMVAELFEIYSKALADKGISIDTAPCLRVTVQGGIGTAQENGFLMNHYQLDATGWGSPFLLVPEATNVDEETLQQLAEADSNDFYISRSSPLGIPFNNFSRSTGEIQRLERIAKGRPGSPCVKKFLVSNTEFTEKPICTASREYQNLKLKQLDSMDLPQEEYKMKFDEITEKNCLCEGLCTSAYIKNDILKKKESKAVIVCPGPNLAYFSKVFSLDEMVNHIYGKIDLLSGTIRSNMFINELNLYVGYLKKDISQQLNQLDNKKVKQLEKFKEQLLNGISYYRNLADQINNQTEAYLAKMQEELSAIEEQINLISIGRLVPERV